MQNTEKDTLDSRIKIFPCIGCSMKSDFPSCRETCTFSYFEPENPLD